MLVLSSIDDLKKYLDTRAKMARAQGTSTGAGAAYGFEESIKAVEAFARALQDERDAQSAEYSEAIERLSNPETS
jgi:hypothetical protein